MTSCVVHGKPAEARRGLLCTVHFERLDDMLRAIEDEAAMLSAIPSMAIRTGSGGGSLASERAPARLDVLAFRDPQTRRWSRAATAKHPLPAPKAFGPWCLFCDHETCTDWRAGRRRDLHDDEHDAGSERLMSVLGVLGGWARVVREDRDLDWPDRVTVLSERQTLARHLEWLAEQPFIDEVYADVRGLLASLQALNGTAPDKPVARCYLPNELGVCGGPVWVDDAEGHAYCGKCKAKWTGPQLLLLKEQMELDSIERARPRTEDGRPMLTAEEMCSRLKIRIGTFRVRAHRMRVASVNGHYDPEPFERKESA